MTISNLIVIADDHDYKLIRANDNTEHFGKNVLVAKRVGVPTDTKLINSRTAVIKSSKVYPEKVLEIKTIGVKEKGKSFVAVGSQNVAVKSVHEPSIKLLRKRAAGDDGGAGDTTKKPKAKAKTGKKVKLPKVSTVAPDGSASTTGAPGAGGDPMSSTAAPDGESSTSKKPDDDDKILEQLMKARKEEKMYITWAYRYMQRWANFLTKNRTTLNRSLANKIRFFMEHLLIPLIKRGEPIYPPPGPFIPLPIPYKPHRRD